MERIRDFWSRRHIYDTLLTYVTYLCKVWVTEHGDSWKRMYFERRLWKLVESFVPRLSDPQELVRMVAVGNKFIRRLEISELMPPVVRADDTSQKSEYKYYAILLHPHPLVPFLPKGAITCKIKHAIKHKTSPARLAQLLQPSLAFCFSLQPMTAYAVQSWTVRCDRCDRSFTHSLSRSFPLFSGPF